MELTTKIALGLTGLVLLSGCAPTVNLEAAEESNTVECANMTVRLPDTISGHARRSVNAQATAAWGDPVSIIVRCGVPIPEPTPLPCFEVAGIDWLRDDRDAPRFIFTTYGLSPATEVIVDSERASGTDALLELARAVGSQSEPVQRCIDPSDVVN